MKQVLWLLILILILLVIIEVYWLGVGRKMEMKPAETATPVKISAPVAKPEVTKAVPAKTTVHRRRLKTTTR